MSKVDRVEKPAGELRKGWTTGACATAATKSALQALLGDGFADPVSITLPRGQTVHFALCHEIQGPDFASATIIKDAGDDPDVTHLAKITSSVRIGAKDSGVTFKAGSGVGTVTLEGLPVAVGEPAINPVPRAMMQSVVQDITAAHQIAPDIEISISVEDGEELARHTWNPRLGIIGGLSILGTTGIVNPFSCSAWISSIHRGIDVSRAAGFTHLLAATGSTSEEAVRKDMHFPDPAIIDMGDFAGGLLKYLRANPVENITIAGGFAKLTKLAQGAMDLHSGRSQVDFNWLASEVATLGGSAEICQQVVDANTAMQVLEICSNTSNTGGTIDIAGAIAKQAQAAAHAILAGSEISVEIVVVSRNGEIIARHG